MKNNKQQPKLLCAYCSNCRLTVVVVEKHKTKDGIAIIDSYCAVCQTAMGREVSKCQDQ